jgi:hypothetical protein
MPRHHRRQENHRQDQTQVLVDEIEQKKPPSSTQVDSSGLILART